MFDVAAIIINYNSSGHTQNCIKSIYQNTTSKTSFQVIVVDNCSEYEDYQILKNFVESNDFSNLKLVRSKINTGFGGGNMMGYHYANSKYVAFINNDTLLLNDCLSILKNAMEQDSNRAVVGGQSYKEDGTAMQAFDHFASITKELLGRDLLEKINPKKYPARKKTYINPIKVNYVQGSFMFIDCEIFNKVGGFDTNIFLYYEETDLSLRISKLNKSSYLIPDAKYIHIHGASTPKNILIKTELKLSLLYVIRKHYGYLSYWFLLNYLKINYALSTVFKPKYWYLFYTLMQGAPLSKSLKTKQKIAEL